MTNANRIVVSGATLILSPELAKHLGKSAALVLQQVHYWLSQQNRNFGIIENGVQWIRNSYKQWQQQMPHISLRTIRRAFSTLEDYGIIQSQTLEGACNYPGGDQVKYYTINYDTLEQFVGKLSNVQIHRPGCLITNEKFSYTTKTTGKGDKQQISLIPMAKMTTPPSNIHQAQHHPHTTNHSRSAPALIITD